MIRGVVVLTLAVALLWAPSAGAQQPPPGRPSWRQRCASVLPRQAVAPILASHRDRLRTARDNLIKEERALRALLIADNSTRPTLDAQSQKTIEARNALLRIRLDMLWELRGAVPAQNRAQAFRCVERLMLRWR